MNKMLSRFALLFIVPGVISCNNAMEKDKENTDPGSFEKGTYAYDADFLRNIH
jgi:hypothetical protein